METINSLTKEMSSCTTKRKYGVRQADSTSLADFIDLSYLIEDAVYGVLTKQVSMEEAEDAILHAYDNDSSVQGIDKIEKGKDLWRLLSRYIDSEKRKPEMPPELTLDIFGVECNVKPSLLYCYESKPGCYHIEAVRLINKKPGTISESQMALYALLFYAKQIADMKYPGKSVEVCGSFYFLRKKDDSLGNIDPSQDHFDPDFFEVRNGKNIQNLTDVYDGTISDPTLRGTNTDARFATVYAAFLTGSKHDYDPTDCKYCPLAGICSYHEAPSPIDAVPAGSAKVTYTDAQKKVIAHRKGLARVIAGAGTGKTATLAGTVVSYLKDGDAPESLVVVTFTNAAAAEIKERIAKLAKAEGLDVDTDRVVVRTFNALGDDYLKENFAALGYTEEPRLISESEKLGKIDQLLSEHEHVAGLDYKSKRMNNFGKKGAIYVASEIFGIFKGYDINQANIDQKLDLVLSKVKGDYANESIVRGLLPIFAEYQMILKDENLIDYVDQERAFANLFSVDAEIFENSGIKRIVVDEFQDSNLKQLEILKILKTSKSYESLMVVGDDAQAIYGFRDTSPEGIIKFFDLMGESGTDYLLVENFRSTPEILSLANKEYSRNQSRVDKMLMPTKANGPAPRIQAFLKSTKEYEFITKDIEAKIASGVEPNSIAVIAYTKAELLKVKAYLEAKNIECTMLVPEPLKENSRIVAAVALFNFLTKDNDEADIATYINACIGGEWFKLTDKARKDTLKEYVAFSNAFKDYEAEDKYNTYLELLARIPGGEKDETYADFLEQIGRNKFWSALVNFMLNFDIYGDGDTFTKKLKYPGVTLTTAHSSKGLEWDIVYNTITKYDAKDLRGPKVLGEIEERRRLLFVSITRARKELVVTSLYYSFGTQRQAQDPMDGQNLHRYMQELYGNVGYSLLADLDQAVHAKD